MQSPGQMTRPPTARPKEAAASRPDRRSKRTDRSWARHRIFLHEVINLIGLPKARHPVEHVIDRETHAAQISGAVLLMLYAEMHITGGRCKRNNHEDASRARLTWVNAERFGPLGYLENSIIKENGHESLFY